MTNVRHAALLAAVADALDVVLNDLSDEAHPPPEEVVVASLTAARALVEEIRADERQKTCWHISLRGSASGSSAADRIDRDEA